ncbi:hypothetical protein, partial [Bacteroides fragilis]
LQRYESFFNLQIIPQKNIRKVYLEVITALWLLPINRYFYAIQHKIGPFYIPKPKKGCKFARSKG